LLQHPGEGLAGELSSLVGVEDFKLALAEGLLECLNTEASIQGV